MTLLSRLGRVNGTLESLELELTVWDDARAFVSYDDALTKAKSDRPATILGMTASDTKPQIKERGRYAYTFGMVYESDLVLINGLPTPTPTDGVTREAATIAKSVKRTDFLASVGVYGPDGENVTSDYPGLKLKVDVSGQDSHYHRSAGVTFDPLPETHVKKLYPRNALVTATWLKSIEDIVARGCFNDASYDGYPQGSLQLVRFNAQPRNTKDWEFIFGFGHKPPQTSVDVGNTVVIPELRGNYYYYTRDQITWDETKKILQPKTKVAIVGKVWEEENFPLLAIALA